LKPIVEEGPDRIRPLLVQALQHCTARQTFQISDIVKRQAVKSLGFLRSFISKGATQ